jgi:hypothetical protein
MQQKGGGDHSYSGTFRYGALILISVWKFKEV